MQLWALCVAVGAIVAIVLFLAQPGVQLSKAVAEDPGAPTIAPPIEPTITPSMSEDSPVEYAPGTVGEAAAKFLPADPLSEGSRLRLTPEQLGMIAEWARREDARATDWIAWAKYDTEHADAILAEALTRFGDQPALLLAAALSNNDDSSPKTDLYERLKAAAPDNPLGFLLSAAATDTRDTSRFLAELSEALKRPNFYAWQSEAWDSRNAALQVIGIRGSVATLLSAFSGSFTEYFRFSTIRKRLENTIRNEATSVDEADGARSTLQQFAELLNTPQVNSSLIGSLIRQSIARRAIQDLPKEARPAWLGRSVGEALSAMEAESAEVREVQAEAEGLMQLRTDEIPPEYLRALRQEGERAALRWLKAWRQKQATPITDLNRP
jgi:hypothetical protein